MRSAAKLVAGVGLVLMTAACAAERPLGDAPVTEPASTASSEREGDEDLGSWQGSFPEARALMRSPAFNPEGKRLSEAERRELRELVRRVNDDLEWIRRYEVRPAIEDHVEALIAAGEGVPPPCPGEPLAKPGGVGHVQAMRHGFLVEFDSTLVPEIVAARRSFDEAAARHEAELVRYFASLPGTR